MSGARKLFVWFLAIGLLLVVAVGVAVKIYVTKDRLLTWLVPPLEEELGRAVSIGDVSIGFTSFDLIDFSVSGTESDEPLASAGRVRIAWRLMPLLSARLEVAEATVESPRFHLVRLADGTLDIDDLTKKNDAEAEGKHDRQTPRSGDGAGGGAVVVELITIADGSLTFEDRMESPTKSYVVDNFDVEVTGISGGDKTLFSITAALGPLGGAPLELKGSLLPESSDLSANLRVGSFELKALNQYMGEGPAFASGSALVNVGLTANGGVAGPVELDVGLTGMKLGAGAEVGKAADLSVKARLTAAQEKVELHNLHLDIDGQVIEATGGVALAETPLITLSAKAEKLFFDRLTALLPPESGENTGKTAPSKPAKGGAKESASSKGGAKIGVEADVDLSVGHLEASGLAFDEVALDITLKNGVLKVNPLSSKFYEGKISLKSEVELEREGTPLTAEAWIDGVRIEQLLPALSPSLKDTITGELDADLTAGSSGSGVKGLIAKLDGKIHEGKISNSPAFEQLAVLFKTDSLREINFYSLLWDVKVKEGVATVEQLHLDGRELALRGDGTIGLEDLRLNMGVVASVPAEIAKKLFHDKNIMEALTDEQGRVGVPLRLTGVATEPKYSLDERKLSKVAGKAAKKAVTKEVEKLLEKEAGKLAPVEKVLPGLMDKLFGK